MGAYIYQRSGWPTFTWDNTGLLPLLGKVRNQQGRLIGKMESLGFDLRKEATGFSLQMIKDNPLLTGGENAGLRLSLGRDGIKPTYLITFSILPKKIVRDLGPSTNLPPGGVQYNASFR